jgi:hypothetical protein
VYMEFQYYECGGGSCWYWYGFGDH